MSKSTVYFSIDDFTGASSNVLNNFYNHVDKKVGKSNLPPKFIKGVFPRGKAYDKIENIQWDKYLEINGIGGDDK